MARRTHEDALGVTGAETVIGAGVIVHGNITSESDIFVDGDLDGSIKTGGDLTIGVNAHIKANIEATNVTVAGLLAGNITVAGEATIRETGNVHGDIKSSGLVIQTGGIFAGRSLMEQPASMSSPTDPALTKTKRPAQSSKHTDSDPGNQENLKD